MKEHANPLETLLNYFIMNYSVLYAFQIIGPVKIS